jgi:hypothetical protein
VRVQIFEGLSATAGARRQTTQFDPDATFRGENLAQQLDERVEALEGSIGYALTPLTTVSFGITHQKDRFDVSTERDADTLKLMPTVSFSPLAMLSGSAAFGYRRFVTLDPNVPDYRGFVAALNLGTTLSDRHRIETVFARDVQYSYEEASIYYVETGVQGTWTWHVSGPIDLRVSGARSRLHYQAVALTDDVDDDITLRYGAGVSWRLRETLRVGLDADWYGRESERDDARGYENRKIAISLTWGKQ